MKTNSNEYFQLIATHNSARIWLVTHWMCVGLRNVWRETVDKTKIFVECPVHISVSLSVFDNETNVAPLVTFLICLSIDLWPLTVYQVVPLSFVRAGQLWRKSCDRDTIKETLWMHVYSRSQSGRRLVDRRVFYCSFKTANLVAVCDSPNVLWRPPKFGCAIKLVKPALQSWPLRAGGGGAVGSGCW